MYSKGKREYKKSVCCKVCVEMLWEDLCCEYVSVKGSSCLNGEEKRTEKLTLGLGCIQNSLRFGWFGRACRKLIAVGDALHKTSLKPN